MTRFLTSTVVALTLVVLPSLGHAETPGSTDTPVSTPGSYGSDANGATSDNTLSSTTGMQRGEKPE